MICKQTLSHTDAKYLSYFSTLGINQNKVPSKDGCVRVFDTFSTDNLVSKFMIVGSRHDFDL